MSRPRPYRVRVNKVTEVWVDVMAMSAEEAEQNAAKLNGVVGVFGRSATLAEKRAIENEPAITVDEADVYGRPH